MKRRVWTIALVLLLLPAAGCGEGESGDPTADSSGTPDVGIRGANPDAANSQRSRVYQENVPPPDAVAGQFLEARRSGDHTTLSSLLTAEAEQRQTIDYSFSGAKTATFEVVETQFIEGEKEQGAHVLTKWTDNTGPDGQLQTDEMILVFRREPPGWRIAGFITKVKELGGKAFAFDFEDPAQMKAMIEHIDAEVQAASQKPPAGANPTRPDPPVAEKPRRDRTLE